MEQSAFFNVLVIGGGQHAIFKGIKTTEAHGEKKKKNKKNTFKEAKNGFVFTKVEKQQV